MDRTDEVLREFFTPAAPPALGARPLGGAMKTALLRLERVTPAVVGCTSTRIVCRHGCAAERRVREAHRVVFASVDDARSVGYRPCRVCRPARLAGRGWMRGSAGARAHAA